MKDITSHKTLYFILSYLHLFPFLLLTWGKFLLLLHYIYFNCFWSYFGDDMTDEMKLTIFFQKSSPGT